MHHGLIIFNQILNLLNQFNCSKLNHDDLKKKIHQLFQPRIINLINLKALQEDKIIYPNGTGLLGYSNDVKSII